MDNVPAVTESAYFRTLGCEVRRLGEGEAEVALPLAPHLRNRADKMHGGALFSLVDITMGLACSTAHGFENLSVTLECKINYLRAVSEGEVICIARVLHAGRRTLVVDADVFQGEKLMAKAQGTFVAL